MNKYPLIRKIYLYLFSAIGLVLVVIGIARLVTLGLKVYIFTQADIYIQYPASRPKFAPAEGPDGVTQQFIEPTKEELEEFERRQGISNRQREAAESFGFIIVGLPLYLYHWYVIRKDKKEEINQRSLS